MAPKQHFDVVINRSLDPKIRGYGAKAVVWPYDHVVPVREGWVDLEPMLLVKLRVAK